MSLFKKDADGCEPRPVEDILEGVDAIGTIIDESLPRLEEQLSALSGKLDHIEEMIVLSEDGKQADSADPDQITERLDLLDQRLLTLEQSTAARCGDLSDQLRSLEESLATLHEKLDTLLAGE